MAAPTNAAFVKKVLANSEPSTHDPKRTLLRYRVDTVRWGTVVEHSHEHIARF